MKILVPISQGTTDSNKPPILGEKPTYVDIYIFCKMRPNKERKNAEGETCILGQSEVVSKRGFRQRAEFLGCLWA